MLRNKKRTNAVYVLFLTIILFALFLFVLRFTDAELPLTIKIKSGDSFEEIRPWYDNNGTWYFFLPSYAELENAALHASKDGCMLGGAVLSSKQSLGFAEANRKYSYERHSLFINESANIVFMRSANVASVYIETETGKMGQIYNDKNHKEKINIRLYDKNGNLNYAGTDDTIKGRGNSTWRHEKKPFNITTHDPQSLLGMPNATKWVLLANPYDESNLRNKLIQSMSTQLGFQWTPHCEYVDVYLNGEYNGLYLLTEKVEVGENRLDIESGNGVLCSAENKRHWDVLEHPILTKNKRAVEIHAAGELSNSEIKRTCSYVQQLEDTILVADPDYQFIDLDSWVKKYLLDEIFENLDADVASSYFYFVEDSGNVKCYAGPIWDMDRTMGNDTSTINPIGFYAKRAVKSDYVETPWYSSLYKNETFFESVKEYYEEIFSPLLNELISSDIDDLSQKIALAGSMNSIRWAEMFERLQTAHNSAVITAQDIIQFLTERKAFLDDAWLNDTEYCEIIIEPHRGDNYSFFAIKSGECADDFPTPETLNIENFVAWYDAETDMPFDFSKPIEKNHHIYAVSEAVPQSYNIETWLEANALLILSAFCAAIGVCAIVLIYVDVRRNGKGCIHGKH